MSWRSSVSRSVRCATCVRRQLGSRRRVAGGVPRANLIGRAAGRAAHALGRTGTLTEIPLRGRGASTARAVEAAGGTCLDVRTLSGQIGSALDLDSPPIGLA